MIPTVSHKEITLKNKTKQKHTKQTNKKVQKNSEKY